jgi:predicted PurR-regulated permease PerM
MEKRSHDGAAGENRGVKQISSSGEQSPGALPRFAAAAVVLVLAGIAFFAAGVIMLVFASILLAVLLQDGCNGLRRFVPLPTVLALPVVVVVTLGILAAVGWLLEPNISAQIVQLFAVMPASVERVQSWLEQFPAARHLMLAIPGSLFDDASLLFAREQQIFSNVLDVASRTAIVVFVALYLAAQPRAYIDGFLRLVPPTRRHRTGQVMGEIGTTLTHWLRGKLLSMLVVGALTAGGLALIGLPLALALGIIAGLLDFIPYIGPILAGLPAGLIAFTTEPVLVGYVALLFFVVQSIEGYLLLPLVERNTVAIPPAVTIMMQVLMWLAFGLPGAALATPLAAVLAVAIRMLYVEDVLGER